MTLSARKRKILVRKIKRWVYLALSAGFVIILIYGVRDWLRTSSAFTVMKIKICGNKILTESELLALAHVKERQRIFDIDLAAVEQRIRTHPFVKEVSVVRSIPATLKIYIIEREPIAVLKSDKMALLDAQGYLLPPVPGRFHNLPTVSLNHPLQVHYGEQVASKKVQEAIRFLKIAKVTEPFLYSKIARIYVDPSKGLILHLNGRKAFIIFGQDDYSTKLSYLKAILGRIGEQGNVVSIDLRFKGQVVVKERS